MSHVFIDPDGLDWNGFVSAQEGRGFGPLPPTRYFQGFRYQRGSGILGSIAKFLLPIAKNIATQAGQEGISAGTKMLGDISQGKNVKEALMEHSKQGLENLATKLQQCGKGKNKIKKKTISKKAKPFRIDQLGPF